ncbi:hypothetical protein [Niveibacterium sp.]|uniref:hypothetical protein n=1 Tax=Niveibacterium sp. TaxID=2017444 RepID=UPI0035AFF5D6
MTPRLTAALSLLHPLPVADTEAAGFGDPNNTGGPAAIRAAFFMSDCAPARLLYGVRAWGSLRAGRFLCSGSPTPRFGRRPFGDGRRIKPSTQEAIMVVTTRTSARSTEPHTPVRLAFTAARQAMNVSKQLGILSDSNGVATEGFARCASLFEAVIRLSGDNETCKQMALVGRDIAWRHMGLAESDLERLLGSLEGANAQDRVRLLAELSGGCETSVDGFARCASLLDAVSQISDENEAIKRLAMIGRDEALEYRSMADNDLKSLRGLSGEPS